MWLTLRRRWWLLAGYALLWGFLVARLPAVVPFALWYLVETTWLVATLARAHPRKVVVRTLLLRLAGTVLGLGIGWWVLDSWDQRAALAVLLLLLWEAVWEGGRRRKRSHGTADVVQASPQHTSAGWALRCALSVLAIGAFALTLLGHGVRQTLFDARTYAVLLSRSTLYEQALTPASELARDTLRSQRGDVRRVASMLSDKDLRTAVELLLPREWSAALVEQAMDKTLVWLDGDSTRKVPAISVPVGDLQRHLQDAVSVLADVKMAELPLCSAQLSRNAFCRVPDVSPAAHVAIYKPQVLAQVDETFALIPPDLDLSTAVSMSPGTFREPLKMLEQVRSSIQRVDRALSWVTVTCLLLWVGLWCASAATAPRPGMWMAGVLSAAGSSAWIVSWGHSILPSERLFAALLLRGQEGAAPAVDLVSSLLGVLIRQVHVRISLIELAVLVAGGLLALVCWLAPATAWRAPLLRLMGPLVVALAIGVLVWGQALSLGQRAYKRAVQAHHDGDVKAALSHYRTLDRLYPFAVADWTLRVWRGRSECERYQRAVALYEQGDYEGAVGVLEALLVGTPAVAVRKAAEPVYTDALYAWADELVQAGETERALDRYRTVRDVLRDREVQQRISALHVEQGDALLSAGDHLGAVETYGRIFYDITHPRLWATADARRAEAYCAWTSALTADGQTEKAEAVCAELRAQYPDTPCSACEP